jgi:hypothetical protein
VPKPTTFFISLIVFIMLTSVADAVRIVIPEMESGQAQLVQRAATATAPRSKVPKNARGHHVDSTMQKIVSRLTSQEMDEKYWLDSSAPPEKPHQVLMEQRVRAAGEDKLPRQTRIVTIPMSAVPPRLQNPGSSKGMPPKMRIVEIDRSQQTLLQKIFRRAIHSEGNMLMRKKTFSVDLHGGIIGVGEYYSLIELGSKRIRVQVDTGSSTLAGTCARRGLESEVSTQFDFWTNIR